VLPSAIAVSHWNGARWVAVRHPHGSPASRTTITFDPVTTSALRLDMTGRGFLAISALTFH
jgi:hypothetical protein